MEQYVNFNWFKGSFSFAFILWGKKKKTQLMQVNGRINMGTNDIVQCYLFRLVYNLNVKKLSEENLEFLYLERYTNILH